MIGGDFGHQRPFYWPDGSLGLGSGWTAEIKRLIVPRTQEQPLESRHSAYQESGKLSGVSAGQEKATLVLPRVRTVECSTGARFPCWKLLEPARVSTMGFFIEGSSLADDSQNYLGNLKIFWYSLDIWGLANCC